MIAAGSPRSFSPYGREHCKTSGDAGVNPAGSRLGAVLGRGGSCRFTPSSSGRTDAGDDILDAIRDFSLSDREIKEQDDQHYESVVANATKEGWILRDCVTVPADNIHADEELYFHGNTAVWSRGGDVNFRRVLLSMTMETPLQQVLWCNFKQGDLEDAGYNESKAICSACLVNSDRNQSIHVYADNGEDFIVFVPFQVAKVWPTKFGLLLERKLSGTHQKSSRIGSKGNNILRFPNRSNEKDVLPTLFSMLHPLDDIMPVTRRSDAGNIAYVTNSNQHVVFTSDNPSIVVTYDVPSSLHTIWRIRPADSEERLNAIISFDNSISEGQCPPTTAQGTPVGASASLATALSTRSHFTLSSHSPSTSSPLRGLLSRCHSPLVASSRPHTPSIVGGISRTQSPKSQSFGGQQPRAVSSPALNASLLGNMSRTPLSGNVSDVYDKSSTAPGPLLPDLCLDPIWSEPRSSFNRDLGANGQASKVFFIDDAVGQKFICFLVPQSYHLRCVKVEEANDRMQLIFGSITFICARDAVPLLGSSLMVVLDLSGSLVIYTGTTKICKVHTGLVVNAQSGGGALLQPVIDGAFPHPGPPSSSRRGSLVTSSRPHSPLDALFEEEMRQMSPVPVVGFMESIREVDSFVTDGSPGSVSADGIKALRDPVRNRMTVVMSDESMFRMTIPTVSSSSLVGDCLKALRLVLPRDVTLQMVAKWYVFSRAPGNCETTAIQEWSSFAVFLLSSMGYDTERSHVIRQLDPRSSQLLSQESAPAKKFKPSENGSDEDWLYLMSYLGKTVDRTPSIDFAEGFVDSEAMLFSHIPAVLYALHLFYEELKLDVSCWSFLPIVVKLLLILASDLGIEAFVDHYWRDFPDTLSAMHGDHRHIREDSLSNLIYPSYLSSEAPCIHRWLEDCLCGQNLQPFPYLVGVANRTRVVVMSYIVLCGKKLDADLSAVCLKPIGSLSTSRPVLRDVVGSFSNSCEATVIAMLRLGLTLSDLDSLPVGIALLLKCAIYKCRRNPPTDWPVDAYLLIGRADLAAQLDESKVTVPRPPPPVNQKLPVISETKKPSIVKNDYDDGMDGMDDAVLELLYGRDLRVAEVRRLLQSSKPARIAVVQRPEVVDHDFVEEQERNLYTICIRTMALPIGRGMFTLSSLAPVVTEVLPIPKLCLTGRAPPRDSVVDLSHIDVPSNMSLWPLFHNGVAAGLRIAPGSSDIDSSWIVYNKPKTRTENPVEHAGFLMALGLNGHLANLDVMNIYNYVAKGHEATCLALLLGIAASKRGTKDVSATKLLSIHVEALLPPSPTELDIPHVVQVAAVLGIGLVYQETAHRHMAEVLLTEIGRPPGPEMENSTDRESYSLAAGLALGMITLGKGSNIAGLSDLGMADWLYHYMIGGPKRPAMGPVREKYRSASYQIKEGDLINVDVTSPGATLALGLMFFATGNRAIANWMVAPDTQYLLDFVRPDFLLLRTLSRGLIMWDEVLPTPAWIDGHLPQIIATAVKRRVRSNNVDDETLSQAYCNIVAGACMAMGLRFAGSANREAYKTLLKYSRTFMSLLNKSTQAGRSTVETCTNTIVLALASVMCGTGDLEVLRMCRCLHLRVGSAHPHVHYGSHLAVHMAIGLLFFGGGRYTLSSDPLAVAALVCAFFPKFPMHSNDNRYHLQALRHLYVLAARPRLIVPRDIDTGRVCFTHLSVTFKETTWYSESSILMKAPCLLPDLNLLSEVRVSDPRYWSVIFNAGQNWTTLANLLDKGGNLFVKQKVGCLSYSEDPNGFRSLLAQAIVQRPSGTWDSKPEAVLALTSNATIHNLVSMFLPPSGGLNSAQESLCRKHIALLLQECVSREKLDMFPTLVSLLHLSFTKPLSSLQTRQLRLALATNRSSAARNLTGNVLYAVVDPEFLVVLDSLHKDDYESWSADMPDALVRYFRGDHIRDLPMSFAKFLVRFRIPPPHVVSRLVEGPICSLSLPTLCLNLNATNVLPEDVLRIYRYLGHEL